MIIRYYTDGACSTNGTWQGGWSMVCVAKNHITSVGGFEPKTTNNRMELKGFLQALIDAYDAVVEEEDDELNCTQYCFEICTDSAYIHNCFKQKWYESWERNGWRNAKKEPVANRDLWEEILDLVRKIGMHRLTFTKVKGHNGDKYNEMADEIAVKCKDEQKEYFKCFVLKGE